MKKPIKVAHTATSYQSVVTILDSKLRALDKYDGLDVSVISSPPEKDERRNPAVRFIAVPMARSIKPLSDLKSTWQLYKILKSEKFDVVHSHTSKAGFISAVAGKMAGVPMILHTHHGLSFFEGQNRIKYHINHFLEKTACKLRNHTFTQNRGDTPECVKLIGSEDKVTYEGNGVDIGFVNQSAKNQLLDAQKDYPRRGLKLILVCRLEPVKRVSDFFKTVCKLIQDGVDVSCVVAGGGRLKQTLRKQLVEMGLAQRINIVGFTNRAHGLIAASDIALLCSEKEGVPRAIMEAMALQKPVVATDVAGTRELVVDGKTGFLVSLGDTGAMAEKVKLLAEDANMRKQMGSCGLKRVSEHFNEVKVADLLHEFYMSSVLQNH